MKIQFYISILICLFGCKHKPEKKEQKIECSAKNDIEYPTLKKGTEYFGYDQVFHYKNSLDENKAMVIYNKENKVEDEILLKSVLLDTTPSSIRDTLFVKNLERIGYEKEELNRKTFPKLNKIFREKNGEVIDAACIYIYRDILIFKKNSKISGIVKICFHCCESSIYSTKFDFRTELPWSDCEELEKIFDNKTAANRR